MPSVFQFLSGDCFKWLPIFTPTVFFSSPLRLSHWRLPLPFSPPSLKRSITAMMPLPIKISLNHFGFLAHCWGYPYLEEYSYPNRSFGCCLREGHLPLKTPAIP